MRVAVLGAGYAGLALARRLERALPPGVDLVVVDESGTHLVQHELHRVIRRPSLADHLELPLADLLERAEVRRASVTAVDAAERRVSLDEGGFGSGGGRDGTGGGDDGRDGTSGNGKGENGDGRDGTSGDGSGEDGAGLSYDVGAVCLGALTDFHGLAGVREHATPLKAVGDARAIREAFLALPDDGTVVVGGAGLSGVQVAGELAALAREEGTDPAIVLLEQESAVAPGFPERFQRAVRSALQARDVAVRTGSRVVAADAAAVELAEGSAVEYDQLVWTGGIRGPRPFGDVRPVVRADLRLADRTFGLGDAVRVVDARGEAVPASAQAAVRQARVAAENVRLLVDGGDGVFEPRLERFTFDSPGWLVSVGDGAVAQVGPTVLTGAPARALKATVGASYLTAVGAVGDAVDVVYDELGLGGEEPPDDVEWPGDAR